MGYSLPSEKPYYTLSSSGYLIPSLSNRNEILQSRANGYMEFTYWGEQPPIYDKVKRMNDDEFDSFINEVEENDANLY